VELGIESEASHLKSRAAHFDVDRKFLEVNQDFSVFRELVEYGLNLINPTIATFIATALKLSQSSFTLRSSSGPLCPRWPLFGTVRVGGARDSTDWISDEALTAAVLPRVYLLNDMKRYIKSNPNIKRDLMTSPTTEEDAA